MYQMQSTRSEDGVSLVRAVGLRSLSGGERGVGTDVAFPAVAMEGAWEGGGVSREG